MTRPDNISIRSLTSARRAKRRCDAILTIEDPGLTFSKILRYQNSPHPPQLILRFEDIDDEDPELATAQPHQVAQAIEFAREFEDRHLIIHCRAGISRSTAMAYAILCDRLGPGREREALDAVFRIRPPACPNLLVARLADDILDRGGAMMEQLRHKMSVNRSFREMVSLRRQHVSTHRYDYAPRPKAPGYDVQLIQNRKRSSLVSPSLDEREPEEQKPAV